MTTNTRQWHNHNNFKLCPQHHIEFRVYRRKPLHKDEKPKIWAIKWRSIFLYIVKIASSLNSLSLCPLFWFEHRNEESKNNKGAKENTSILSKHAVAATTANDAEDGDDDDVGDSGEWRQRWWRRAMVDEQAWCLSLLENLHF